MALRKKMVVRLSICAAAAVLIGGGGIAAYIYSNHRLEAIANKALNDGAAAMAAGKSSQAAAHFRIYLQSYPDNVKVLMDTEKVLEHVASPNDQNLVDCLSMLRHILDLQPKNTEAATRLLDLYQRIGYYTEASQLADNLLKSDPNNPKLRKAKAESLFALRKYEDASKIAVADSDAHPNDIDSQTLTLEIMVHTANGAMNVQKRADDQLKAHPGDIRFVLLESIAASLTDRPADAAKWLDQASAMPPPDAATVLMMVKQDEVVGRYDAALQLLDRESVSMKDPQLSAEFASRLWQLERYQEVVDRFPTGNAKDPVELTAMRCMSLHALKRDADAAAARAILTDLSDSERSAALWGGVIDQVYCQGKPDDKEWIAACRQGILEEPENPYFQQFLAEACARVDDVDAAVKAWQAAASLAPGWAAPLVRLSQFCNATGRAAQALEAANEAVKRAPNNHPAQMSLIAAQASQLAGNDSAGADALLASLANVEKQSATVDPQIPELRGEIMLRAGRSADFKKYIQDSLSQTPPLPADALIGLADLSIQAKFDLERQCMDVCQKEYGMTPTIGMAVARLEQLEGTTGNEDQAAKDKEGRTTLETARDADKNGADTVDWSVDHAQYADLVKDAAAHNEWVQISEKHPESAAIQWDAMASPAIQADHAAVGQILDRLKAEFGDQPLGWKMAQAQWLMFGQPTDADRVEAAVLLGAVSRAAPDMLEPHMRLADCYLKLHNTEGAITQLREAANLAPDNVSIAWDLANLLQSKGDYDGAQQYLERVANSPAASADERRAAANLLSQGGDPLTALAAVKNMAGQSNDIATQLLLGQLYFKTGDLKSLDGVCANLLKSSDPDSLVFVADVYTNLGRTKEATDVLNRLEKVKLDPVTRDVLLGQHAQRMGQTDEAVKYFKDATTVAPTDPRGWRLLIQSSLMQADLARTTAAAAAASKQLPNDKGLAAFQRCLVPAGKLLQEWPEVRSMLTEVMVTPELEPTVIAACQTLSGSAGPLGDQQTAINFRRLAGNNLRLLPLQLLAGQLDMQAGNLAEAIGVASAAMQAFPSEPAPAAMDAQCLYESGRFEEALNAAEEWKNRDAGNSAQSDRMIAMCQVKLGNLSAAANQLAPYANAVFAHPDQYGDLLLNICEARILNGQTAQVADSLRPLLDKSAEARQVWMQVAGNTIPDTAAAADWMREIEPAIPADDVRGHIVLAECWSALSMRSTDSEIAAAAKKTVETFATQYFDKADAPECLSLATMEERVGDPQTAERAYRKVLQLAPNDPIAANNLANLLMNEHHLADALPLAKQAVATRGEHWADFMDTLANIQDQSGKHDDAIKTLTTALKAIPDDIYCRITLVRVLVADNQIPAARSALNELDLRDPDNAPISQDLHDQVKAFRDRLAQPTS